MTPERQAYQDGKDDMRERILTKLNEELIALKGLQNAEKMIELLEHLIARVEKLS